MQGFLPNEGCVRGDDIGVFVGNRQIRPAVFFDEIFLDHRMIAVVMIGFSGKGVVNAGLHLTGNAARRDKSTQ